MGNKNDCVFLEAPHFIDWGPKGSYGCTNFYETQIGVLITHSHQDH
jgi:hypothetical protein